MHTCAAMRPLCRAKQCTPAHITTPRQPSTRQGHRAAACLDDEGIEVDLLRRSDLLLAVRPCPPPHRLTPGRAVRPAVPKAPCPVAGASRLLGSAVCAALRCRPRAAVIGIGRDRLRPRVLVRLRTMTTRSARKKQHRRPPRALLDRNVRAVHPCTMERRPGRNKRRHAPQTPG